MDKIFCVGLGIMLLFAYFLMALKKKRCTMPVDVTIVDVTESKGFDEPWRIYYKILYKGVINGSEYYFSPETKTEKKYYVNQKETIYVNPRDYKDFYCSLDKDGSPLMGILF